MIREAKDKDSPLSVEPSMATAAFDQACEHVRHIRSERINFSNAYTAIVAGGLALLPRASEQSRSLAIVGLGVLVLFSVVSVMSSIRLVVELKNAIANLQRIIHEFGLDRLVGSIEPPRGWGASLPMRWVFPIFFGLTTVSLVVLLVARLISQ